MIEKSDPCKIKTTYELLNFDINTSDLCGICDSAHELIDYLFFECHLSWRIYIYDKEYFYVYHKEYVA